MIFFTFILNIIMMEFDRLVKHIFRECRKVIRVRKVSTGRMGLGTRVELPKRGKGSKPHRKRKHKGKDD
jgi:hypothetical protein